MTSITVHDIDDQLKKLLRIQAQRHGCSIEQEARDILHQALQGQVAGVGFAQKISQRFAGLATDDLPSATRSTARHSVLQKA